MYIFYGGGLLAQEKWPAGIAVPIKVYGEKA
jgi:hypothetical protein